LKKRTKKLLFFWLRAPENVRFQRAPTDKSLLLLFFKKEELFFFEKKNQKTFASLAMGVGTATANGPE
jgi:hypothetical protein